MRLDPEPAPLAAVARGGVVVDRWLCVTAVTVAEEYRRYHSRLEPEPRRPAG